MRRFLFKAPGLRPSRVCIYKGTEIPPGMLAIPKSIREERILNRQARDRVVASLETDLADVLTGFREGITVGQAEVAVLGGDARVIVNAAAPNQLEAQLVAVVTDRLEDALEEGVEIGLRFAPPEFAGVSRTLAHDAAVAHVQRQAALSISGITEGTQAGIRTVLEMGITDVLSPVEVATRVGDLAGLTPRQVTATENYRAALTRRLAPVEEALTPQVQALIDADVAAYRDRQMLLRGRAIAETEIQTAIVEGEKAFWDQAIAEGAVDAERLYKIWQTVQDSRVCLICAPLHGTAVKQQESFQTGSGALPGPPAHPRCRCYLAYEQREDEEAA